MAEHMKKHCLYFSFLMMMAACLKSHQKEPHPCTVANSNCSHQTGDITGSWILESYRSYSANFGGNLNPPWTAADCANPVLIEFRDDSIFSYNINFSLKYDSFDRYKMVDQQNFTIYSSGSHTHPLSGKILSAKEIEITNMGVDEGTEYNYDCNQ
jgi:hypothetical protein